MTRIPVEAIEGLEEVVQRWISEVADELREELGSERVDRQNAVDELRDELASLDRVLQARTEHLT